MKRRTWILGGLAATGALVVGWGVMPARSRLGKPELMLTTPGDVALNGWIKITPNGSVILAMPRSEMGQGVHTALPMLVAEELDVPLTRVRLEQAGADKIYGNVVMLIGGLPFHPLEHEGADRFGRVKVKVGEWIVGKVARELGINATGGSSSVADAWMPLRMAAATARASLLGTAAAQWKVPATELVVKDGVVSHASGKSAHYGELAKAAGGVAPGEVTLKDRKNWKLIGQPAARLDVPAKVNGTAQFGMDVRLPGMLFATVRLCPMIGGSPGVIDDKAALAMPGVERLVKLDAIGGATAGIAVVAKTTWHARQGAQAVDVKWQQRVQGALDSEQIAAKLHAALKTEDGFAFFKKGDAADVQGKSTRVIKATYQAPFLAHATMEPMNCTARVKDGKVEIWAPTQVPQMARAIAADIAGVGIDNVTLYVTLLGGGFGRRLDVDFVGQAVRVAMDCGGKPVQLAWSREEDTMHDFYRPMQVADLSAAMDALGNLSSLTIKSAGDPISPRWFERAATVLNGPVDMPDKTAAEGLFDLPYGIEHQHMSHVHTRHDVPIGFWRSVGHSHNAFFSEGFIDELALQAKQDPYVFRRNLLKNAPRYVAVLNLAAEKAKWGSPLPVGHARGIALHESFGSIVAQVVQVSLEGGKPRVHRVTCAIDCGTVVNPNIVAQQMEGAVIFGLTAALYGKIDIKDGVVQQTNFNKYTMLTLAQAPVVDTHIVSSIRPPGGVGEPGVPPVASAVASALFELTGKRHRSLPLLA